VVIEMNWSKSMSKLLKVIFVLGIAAAANNSSGASKVKTAAGKGQSEVSLDFESKSHWVQIHGDAAKVLYEGLSSVPKNNQGEAGSDVFFKSGKSYTCNESSGIYSCTIAIRDPGKGIVK
jgi:hypothetical protein